MKVFKQGDVVRLTAEARKKDMVPPEQQQMWHEKYVGMVNDGDTNIVHVQVQDMVFMEEGAFWISESDLTLAISAPESPPDRSISAFDLLAKAAGHLKDRAVTYDKPEGERSVGATVEAFKAITGVELTEEQGWLFMVLLKLVRSQQGNFKMDNYEDGAAYFALMGEAAQFERKR